MKHPRDMSWLDRAWQAPSAAKNLAALRRRHPRLPFRPVLDAGCGPGINAPLVWHTKYLGVDIEERSIRDARARYCDRFVVGDAGDLTLEGERPFDCIVINSLFHCLESQQVSRLFMAARRLLAPGGNVFVIDQYVPVTTASPRARANRKRFTRTLPRFQGLITRTFCLDAEEFFRLRLGPLMLWQMVHYETGVCG